MKNAIRFLPRFAAFLLIVLLWFWVFAQDFSPTVNNFLIVGSILAVFPTVWLGRKLLDENPTIGRALNLTAAVHAILMILFGVAIIKAIQTSGAWQGWVVPVPSYLFWPLVQLTALLTLLTVPNLALRGLGAPFAIAPTRQLATDWLYRWTRNPMVLTALACLFAIGLWKQSLLFIIWVLTLVTPALIFFLKVYEERELEIRFGQSYLDYRTKTAFLFPAKPKSAPKQSPPPKR